MSDRPVSSPVVRESNLIEALESSPDAVTVFDFEFRILYLNDVARRYLSDGGIDARDVIGRVAWEAMPAMAGSEWETALRRVVADRRPSRPKHPRR